MLDPFDEYHLQYPIELDMKKSKQWLKPNACSHDVRLKRLKTDKVFFALSFCPIFFATYFQTHLIRISSNFVFDER